MCPVNALYENINLELKYRWFSSRLPVYVLSFILSFLYFRLPSTFELESVIRVITG